MLQRDRFVRILVLATCLAAESGCAVFLGNVKPIDQKSTSYGIEDLSQTDPNWMKLDLGTTAGQKDAAASTELPDVAFQSKKTASIISLDSACRGDVDEAHRSLRTLTDRLFFGISDIQSRNEKNLTLEGLPALKTTLTGRVNHDRMTLSSVVLRHGTCTYDLMLVARPGAYEQDQPVFERFVNSMRLK